MSFKLRPADASFAARARKQFTYDFTIAAPASAVFSAITNPDKLDRWIPDFRSARWLTAAPHGVGSLREVTLSLLRVEERILVWEPGQRFVFHISRASIPMLKRMVEDYRLTAAPDGSTRVQWTIAYQATRFFAPLERFIYPRYSRIFEEGSRRLRAHVESSDPSHLRQGPR